MFHYRRSRKNPSRKIAARLLRPSAPNPNPHAVRTVRHGSVGHAGPVRPCRISAGRSRPRRQRHRPGFAVQAILTILLRRACKGQSRHRPGSVASWRTQHFMCADGQFGSIKHSISPATGCAGFGTSAIHPAEPIWFRLASTRYSRVSLVRNCALFFSLNSSISTLPDGVLLFRIPVASRPDGSSNLLVAGTK